MRSRLKYWLALGRVRGLDNEALNAALRVYKTVEGLFSDRGRALPEAVNGVLRRSISEFSAWGEIEDEAALIEKNRVAVIVYTDKDYPPLLKEIHDPPPVIYVKGSLKAFASSPHVAIVGTRHPTHYGLRMSSTLARELTSAGVAVVSGMARGCDTAAHKGALEANGATIAVMGTGIDVVYPAENKRLYEEIAEKGAIISELPLKTKPLPLNFPRRNRIISGITLGVVVVEAPVRSGALMTARLSLECNREVFAVPGSVTSEKSRGTNRLIKEGAVLVEGAEDILNALTLAPSAKEEKAVSPAFDADESLVLSALRDDELHIDEITEKTGFSVVKTSAVLLGMELKGVVKQAAGKRFSKRF